MVDCSVDSKVAYLVALTGASSVVWMVDYLVDSKVAMMVVSSVVSWAVSLVAMKAEMMAACLAQLRVETLGCMTVVWMVVETVERKAS
jgi:hypothetical protein